MNITTTVPSRRRLALVLGALSAFPALTIDLYLPGMPAMADDLRSTPGMVQLTVTTFVIGLALAQVVVGPLSDAWGRRRLLLAGLAVYVGGSLLCLAAATVPWLVAGRVVQSLGAAAATVLARAVVRDHFEGSEMTRFLASLMLVNGVATVAGPIVGGQILELAGWRVVFVVLTVVGALLLAVVARTLPESLAPERRRPARLGATLRTFAALGRDRSYRGHVLAMALMFTAMFAYISASSFVLQDHYGLSAREYSLVFALNAVGIVLLGQLNSRLVGRVADEWTLMALSLVVATAAGATLLLAVVASLPLVVLLVGLFVLVSMLGPVLANGTSLALAPHGAHAGTAASLQGVVQYAVSGVAATVMSSLGGSDAGGMAVAMGVAVLLSTTAALVLHATTPHRTTSPGAADPAARPVLDPAHGVPVG